MLKAYRYKLEPNKSQSYALARTLDVCRELFNLCLFQRKLHPISRYEQFRAGTFNGWRFWLLVAWG
jgi:transposase